MRTKMHGRLKIGFVAFALLAMLVASCGGSKPAEKDKVTVQLSWFHSAEFIGFYVAQELGYYNEANLDVNLLVGGPEIDSIAAVMDGTAQFGITSGDAILNARAAGKNPVAVSSIFRKSPLVVMSLSESGINAPKDLAGKKVGVISTGLDTTWDIQFIAMLNKAGVDPESMTFVPIEKYHGADDLHTGNMEAYSSAFSTNEIIQAKMDGENINSIYYRDYGVEFYNNVIFTSDDLISKNPDMVKRFIQTTLRGYQYAIEHAKETANLPLKYDNTLDVNFQQATIEAQIPLIDTGNAPLGWMDDDIWANTQEILLSQKQISASVDLLKAYTNQFIGK